MIVSDPSMRYSDNHPSRCRTIGRPLTFSFEVLTLAISMLDFPLARYILSRRCSNTATPNRSEPPAIAPSIFNTFDSI